MSAVRSVLKEFRLPKGLWDENVQAVAYIKNRTISRSANGITPYEGVNKAVPSVLFTSVHLDVDVMFMFLILPCARQCMTADGKALWLGMGEQTSGGSTIPRLEEFMSRLLFGLMKALVIMIPVMKQQMKMIKVQSRVMYGMRQMMMNLVKSWLENEL